MRGITYSLKVRSENGFKYYEDVSHFADITLEETWKISSKWIYGYKEFIKQKDLEEVLSNEEYMIEFLTLGVLWICYSNNAFKLNPISQRILFQLMEMRNKGFFLKGGADYIRGILGTLVLYNKDKSNYINPNGFTLYSFIELMRWLAVSGEFTQEFHRLEPWSGYLRNIKEEEVQNLIEDSVSLAVWFEKESTEVLGKYTKNVDYYIKNSGDSHRWKEDYILCNKARTQYHLNMVGAEIMNRAYRKDFLETKQKAILLPSCMRKHVYKNCKARKKSDVFYCQSCDLSCQVHLIKRIARKYNYEVIIVSHESKAFSNEIIKEKKLGVIGVACVINLMSGGWKAKSLGIPAQCVILDYCGCKKHWDKKGFFTTLDINQLEKIMREK